MPDGDSEAQRVLGDGDRNETECVIDQMHGHIGEKHEARGEAKLAAGHTEGGHSLAGNGLRNARFQPRRSPVLHNECHNGSGSNQPTFDFLRQVRNIADLK